MREMPGVAGNPSADLGDQSLLIGKGPRQRLIEGGQRAGVLAGQRDQIAVGNLVLGHPSGRTARCYGPFGH